MKIKAFTGLLDSNTYVLSAENGECMIIDAGAHPSAVFEYIEQNGFAIKYIALTHGHYDHADFVGDYISAFEKAIPVCHESELKVLKSSEANVSSLIGCPKAYDYAFTTLKNGDVLTLGELELTALNMPGHTPGSICLLCENEKIMFTGDVLFAYSYGRTDFLYGSQAEMMDSLRALSRLDREITIYPGHGRSEKLKNIFR